MSSLTTKKPSVRPAQADATTTDDFLGGRISVVQPRNGHRSGSDAVFLAAAVPAEAGERVLDIGAGVGVAGLCLLARVPGIRVTAVEIDPGLTALAARNAERHGVAAQFEIITADVTAPGKVLSAAGLERESYRHLIANPPFYAEGGVRAAPDSARAAAHVMGAGGLAAWVRFFAAMAAPSAQLTLIHRPECLGELLELLDGRFGDVTVFPLFAKQAEPATRIIVQAKKGSKAGLSILPGLVLHDGDGRYSQQAEVVLRGAAALELRASGRRKGHRPGGG
jgi:tRNA1(Val) A37 N6-methylase TrmN6